MPFFDSSNRASCLADYTDALSMIELILNDHPNHLFIIGGDLNCELNGNSVFDGMWADFASKNSFAYCSHLFGPPGFTYHHEKLGHRKMNDHFIISNELLSSNQCSDFVILDEGHNTSDHLPISMAVMVEIQANDMDENSPPSIPKLKWEKLNRDVLQGYSDHLNHNVTSSMRPPNVSCQSVHCNDSSCVLQLQEDYDCLIRCIKSADEVLPRHNPGVEKNWWSQNLSELKRKSVEIHKLWASQGRPARGPIHLERVRVRVAYRAAIKAAQRAPKQKAWNKIHSAMEHSETNNFWSSWKSLYNENKNNFAAVVNGCSSRKTIADEFRKSFINNAKPNNASKVEELNKKFESQYRTYSEHHSENCNCSAYSVTRENVIDAICCMKRGKCADSDGLTPEHFHNAPLVVIDSLVSIFNRMLRHSYVPSQFRYGFMIPLIKDSQGNHSDVANYRGITISPIVSKVFEHTLKIIFSHHLSTSHHQFGFKRKSSTVHALYCFRETVDYFVNNGSRVYCSFLDASKAFDRVIHSGLFIKLMNKNVPKLFLDIIITWHDGLYCRVRWNGHYSDWFHISAGVRQGGVLSPDLYCLYVDELVDILKSMGIGCYVRQRFAAALFYADDMAVLAPSIKGLQSLLDACAAYCSKWDIKLNAKKTKNLFFGKGAVPNHRITLDGTQLPWESSCVYLGVTLKQGVHFGCCVRETLRKFYRSLNSIIRIEGRSDDMVMLRLLEAHCLPILSYAIEIIHVSDRDDCRQMCVAYNAIYRKLFGYSYRESVTLLQHTLGRPTWEEFVEKRKTGFAHRCRLCSNDTVVRIFA